MSSRRAVSQINSHAQSFKGVLIAPLDLAQRLSQLLGLFRNHFLKVMPVVLDFLFQALLVQSACKTG